MARALTDLTYRLAFVLGVLLVATLITACWPGSPGRGERTTVFLLAGLVTGLASVVLLNRLSSTASAGASER